MQFKHSVIKQLFTAAVLAMAASAQAETIGIAASNPGSLYHSTGSAIAKVANEAAGVDTTVQPFASATVYLPAVHNGDYGFGITNVQELRNAVLGEEQFSGRKYDNLRAVTVLFPLRLAFFVRADSDMQTVADLRGKRVVDGFSSQKTIPPLLDASYAAAGIKRSDVKPVMVPNVVGGANAFVAGKADAFIFALGAAKVEEAAASVGGIRALKIDNSPEVLSRVREHFPAAYLATVNPGKRNVGVTEPTHMITYDVALVANAQVAEETVYKIVKAMHENKPALASTFGVFNLFNPNRMYDDLGPIQWHPGAVRFLKEKGAWPAN